MEAFYGTNNQRGVKPFFVAGTGTGSLSDNSYIENVDLAKFKYLNLESPSSPVGMDSFRTPILSEFPNHSPNISRGRSSNTRGNIGLGSRCAAPLSPVENFDTSLFKTPVKVEVLEEDVLVMDGILVGSRSSSNDRVSSSSEFGGSSSSGHNNFYKKDLCRSWEDLSQCRYGYKCQFAHGKEEMRPSRFIGNNKSEAAKSKLHFSSGPTTHGGKYGIVHDQIINPEMETATFPSPSKYQLSSTFSKSKNPGSTIVSDWCPLDDGISVVSTGSVSTTNTYSCDNISDQVQAAKYKLHFSSGPTTHGGKGDIVHNQIINPEMETATLPSPSKYQPFSTFSNSKNPGSTIFSDWCPLDDGISVASTGSISTTNTPSLREDVNSLIENVLYGPPRRKKRLPVFEAICSCE